jgi:hypothetical protein
MQEESGIGFLKIALAHSADGTGPIVRKIGELHIVMLGGVIYPAADFAYILFHGLPPLFYA